MLKVIMDMQNAVSISGSQSLISGGYSIKKGKDSNTKFHCTVLIIICRHYYIKPCPSLNRAKGGGG